MKIYVVVSWFDVYERGYTETEKAFCNKGYAERFKEEMEQRYKEAKVLCDDKYIHHRYDDVTDFEHKAYKWEETRVDEVELV